MKKITAVNVFIVSLMLSGCDSTPSSNVLTFVPSSLPTCTEASEVVVKWNVRAAYPDVQAVQIFVIGEGASETLFGIGDPEGESKTGPWVKPGMPRFILKDKTNGKVLGEGVVNGPKCQ